MPQEAVAGARRRAGSARTDWQPRCLTGATAKWGFMFLTTLCTPSSRHDAAHLSVFKQAPAVTTGHSGKTQAEVHSLRAAAAASALSRRVPSAPEARHAGDRTAGTALPT